MMTGDDDEVLRWRRRIGQAQRIAELVAAGRRLKQRT